MNANTLEPLKLIPIAIDTAKEFNDTNKDEDSLDLDHAESLTNFLWLMSTGKVPPIEFILRPDNSDLQKKYITNRIKQSLKIPSITFSEDTSISLQLGWQWIAEWAYVGIFAVAVRIQNQDQFWISCQKNQGLFFNFLEKLKNELRF